MQPLQKEDIKWAARRDNDQVHCSSVAAAVRFVACADSKVVMWQTPIIPARVRLRPDHYELGITVEAD